MHRRCTCNVHTNRFLCTRMYKTPRNAIAHIALRAVYLLFQHVSAANERAPRRNSARHSECTRTQNSNKSCVLGQCVRKCTLTRVGVHRQLLCMHVDTYVDAVTCRTRFVTVSAVRSLVAWFVGCLVGSFVGSLVRWFVGSLVRWFAGSLVGWFVRSLARWFAGLLVGWLVRSLVRS